MKYVERSYAERAEREKRCKNRLLKVSDQNKCENFIIIDFLTCYCALQVREQSKEIAQEVRDKVRMAKEEELKKLQKIKEKELNEWKRRRQSQIQEQIDCCIQDFGNAHIAAINASCEESESLREHREEQDLMASVRGRVAMLSEQRRREKEAEERLQKKKRKHQKTIGIQADFLTQRGFSENLNQVNTQHAESDEEEVVPKFTSKVNLHKHQNDYNPQNYTSNSVDSSNTSDSAEENYEPKDESTEFNQITNLLKQKMQEVYDAPAKKIAQFREQKEIVEVSSESSSDVEFVPAKKVSPLKKTKKSPQKSILKTKKSQVKPSSKKPTSPPKKTKKPIENNRVRYVDFRNMYETSYEPKKDLVTRSEPTRSLNAKEEAKLQNANAELISKKINEDILR
jgi:hypothetical protein